MIEKETLALLSLQKSEYRIMNVECQRNVFSLFYKKTERSDIYKYSICNFQFRLVRVRYLPLIQDFLILMVAFSFLHFKSEAIFSPHCPANIIDWQAFTFEIHGATSMGKILVPGNVIMYAFMTNNGHGNCAVSAVKDGIALHRPPGVLIRSFKFSSIRQARSRSFASPNLVASMTD